MKNANYSRFCQKAATMINFAYFFYCDFLKLHLIPRHCLLNENLRILASEFTKKNLRKRWANSYKNNKNRRPCNISLVFINISGEKWLKWNEINWSIQRKCAYFDLRSDLKGMKIFMPNQIVEYFFFSQKRPARFLSDCVDASF